MALRSLRWTFSSTAYSSAALSSPTSPISAARPRPRRSLVASSAMAAPLRPVSRGLERALALDDLGGEAQIGLRARAFQVVEQHGLAVRRRLRHPHVPGDHGVVDLLAHELPHIRDDLARKVVARVEHGEHDALDREARVERGPHLLDRAEPLAQAFEGEELAL